jgi:hypothetical protein
MAGQDLKVQKLDAGGERRGRVVRRELPAAPARTSDTLAQIRGVVLLGGSIRVSQLQSSIGRSVLDLPISDHCTLLQRWCDEGLNLLRGLTIPRLQIRLIIDQASAAPTLIAHDQSVSVSVERDPLEYRGSGGVLRDISQGYEDSDYLLVANATQIIVDNLLSVTTALIARGADIAMVSHSDGSPGGFMLARCGALRDIPASGFVDMKEQALPALASKHHVSVLQWPQPSGMSIRTVSQYIDALRHIHRRTSVEPSTTDAFHEDWKQTFAIVEPDARVASSALIHDSVVLKGARVEEGAVVVGSVICPGAVVARGRMVVDEIVRPRERRA